MQGLVDQLVLEIDTNPPYEVVNDDRYNKFKTTNSIPMVFAVKAQARDTKEADMNNLFFRWVGNNHVKFLDSESQARGRLKGKDDDYKLVRPFTQTDFLQEEIMNLEYKQSGNNTAIKQISKSIQKDRFSALKYGLYWIHLEEKKNQARQNENIGDISKFFMGRTVKQISRR